MIKDFVFAWEANKGKLKKYFEEHSKEEYCSYKTVVRLLFELVVNPYLAEHKKGWREPGYNVERIHEICDGEYYAGTLMYMIPRKGQEPDERPRLTEEELEALEKAAEGGPSGTMVVEVPRLIRSTLLIKRPTRERVPEKRVKRGGWGKREKKQVRMAVMLAPARPDYLREWGERWRRFFWKWKDWC